MGLSSPRHPTLKEKVTGWRGLHWIRAAHLYHHATKAKLILGGVLPSI